MHKTRWLSILALLITAGALQGASPPPQPAAITGFRDSAAERALESRFLAVPGPALAGEHLKALTAAPHLAGSPEDRANAEYVAARYREAGLETQIVEYKVWISYPKEISVVATGPKGVLMRGPRRERVAGDPYETDPRIVTPYNAGSPSGDVEGEVVYANYGRPEDFQKLAEMHIDVRGKVLLIRYGENYRGVKSFLAEQHGAAGVLLYSDPLDDGFFKGDVYPKGPWRPWSAVQRGSINYISEFPGDPTTPGVASTPDLGPAKRIDPQHSAQLPKIVTTPLSAADAQPILRSLGGTESPRDWQGALPFTYHMGPGPVRVKVHVKQDYALRTVWDVIGVARDGEFPGEWVISGNHRDAWVFGAVDPNSGTAAQLEAVHGIGALLKSGWKPRRTLVFASWDAEEFGLMGSTEWVEQHAAELSGAVAYLNLDAAVSGPNFGAAAVPSLKDFIREVTRDVPSPAGGSVYDRWRESKQPPPRDRRPALAVPVAADVEVGDLGSGSDFTPFLQHEGVPSLDMSSNGPYGVYHSAFDDYAWFTRFADPGFLYEQEMARVLGIGMLRLAGADVLPFDYAAYAREIARAVDDAERRARQKFGAKAPSFNALQVAARQFAEVAGESTAAVSNPAADARRLNRALQSTERAFLLPQGLPNRPWYRHAIFAPGEYTGYQAVVLPGINDAIERNDAATAAAQIAALTAALDRATRELGSYR
jgi:N-acetylated-alpha-linked acidic dipeptidase